MNRIEELNDDFIDLGAASVETKGVPFTGDEIDMQDLPASLVE